MTAIGEDANEWLGRRGFTIHPVNRRVQLFADALEFSGISLARIWHTAVELRRMVQPSIRTAYIGVDGELTVHNGPLEHTLTAGEMVLCEGGGEIRLLATTPAAYIELRIEDEAGKPPPHRGMITVGADTLAVGALCAMIMVTIGSDSDTTHGRALHLRYAIEQLLLAATTPDRLAPSDDLSVTQRELVARAMQVIASSAMDPEFSVQQLSRSLSVSPQYLRKIMADAGTSAAREIAEARTQRAHHLLKSGRAPSLATARAAGFPSTRTMLKHVRVA